MLEVASLHVYPVKSCAGFSLAPSRMRVDRFGPENDRRWMVVDPQGEFLTQRTQPRLALVVTAIDDTHLSLSASGSADLRIPLAAESGSARATREVVCWADRCRARDEGDAAAQWLSRHLGRDARLVRIDDDFERRSDPRYSPADSFTRFADAFPFLLIGEASLTDLNVRLEAPVPMDRFRPNIVVRGSQPFEEDGWARVRLGSMELELVKYCTRCVTTTIDQRSGQGGKEPLRTLAGYRRREDKVVFGQNALHRSPGTISVGDPIEVLTRREPESPPGP